jgi:hypothetical protein
MGLPTRFFPTDRRCGAMAAGANTHGLASCNKSIAFELLKEN